MSIGSIFAIWKRPDYSAPASVNDFLRTGNEIEIAGYCIYGSSTQLVLASRHGKVDCFTLDNAIGDFILTHPNVKIPNRGNIYSVNEGNSHFWDPAMREYVDSKKDPAFGNPYSLRYVGSMVSDVHRTLLYGGIFMYPADKKSPSGKLRVLYEVFPMSFIMEKAGGKAIDGIDRLLEIRAESIHQRAPCILGSPDDVDDVKRIYEKYRDLAREVHEEAKAE